MKNILIIFTLLSFSFCYGKTDIVVQRPKITKKINYVIGYGSLMQLKSRIRTVPSAVHAFPVMVEGFKRSFGMCGGKMYKTTFLSVTPDASHRINAVYFKVDKAEIHRLDNRESSYDRKKVSGEDLDYYTKNKPVAGDFWIYVNRKADEQQCENTKYPLTQSYVDIFLEGCFQMEDIYHLTGFAKQCVETTIDWPTKKDAWVNDRLHPRRPFDNPYAYRIDKLLSNKIDDYLSHRIE